nr:hypothetical protein [Olivibacter domesticus]
MKKISLQHSTDPSPMPAGIWAKTAGNYRNKLQTTLPLPPKALTGIMAVLMSVFITTPGHPTKDGSGEPGVARSWV